MRTFSVRFFKGLILTILALLILIPTVLAIYFGVKCARLEEDLEALRASSGVSVSQGAGGSGTGTGTGSGQAALSVPVDVDPLPNVSEPLSYQLIYPALYGTAQVADQRVRATDTVYLTFDGSPSSNTRRILDILDEYDVKATFFVMGYTQGDSLEILKEISDRGHTIGIRCYSNSFQNIYTSVESYLDDFNQIYQLVYETTGQKAEIFRFPGGSVNTYNSGIYQELIAEMLRRNFVYFDWNVAGETTQADGLSAAKVKENVLSGVEGKDRAIVMFQDSYGKEAVVDALPDIIEGIEDMGYSFQPLTAAVLPIVFSYQSAP